MEAVGYQAHEHDGNETPAMTINDLIKAVRPTGRIGVVGVFLPQDPAAVDEDAKKGKFAFEFGTFFFKGQSMGIGSGQRQAVQPRTAQPDPPQQDQPRRDRFPRIESGSSRRGLRGLQQPTRRLDQSPAASLIDSWKETVSDIFTLADARAVIAAAEKRAEQIDHPQNIAVVDAGGNLMTHVRMDGAWRGSVDISINKAWTARSFDIETKDLADHSQPGGPFFGIQAINGGRVMIFSGGIPLQRNRNLVGAISVSGGTGD